MPNEIERKFFVKEMPDLSNIQPLMYERYFLERGYGKEIRISKVNDKYFYEEKLSISALERTRDKKEITKEEFDQLQQKASEAIIRENYVFPDNPNLSIKVYHGRFEGLVRAEIEFESEEKARSFVPLPWMGKEMTSFPIARDATLLDVTEEGFKKYIQSI